MHENFFIKNFHASPQFIFKKNFISYPHIFLFFSCAFFYINDNYK